MACGCRKKKESTQGVQTPQTINVNVAEQNSVNQTQSQEKILNEIVNTLNKIGDTN